jgi:hypothetical protein
MFLMRRLTFLAVLLTSLLPLAGQTKDPLIGTWVLDLTRSTFDPGPAPAGSRTMTFTAVDNGFTHMTKTEGGFLNSTLEYTAKYDAKDYKMDPESPLEMVSLKRIDKNTVERTGKIRGKAVETMTLKVSPDGKTLTITTMGSYQGNDYGSVQVLSRQ